MTRPIPLSVRLDPELEAALRRHCQASGVTRSDVVKQSLARYLVSEAGPTLGSLAEAVLPPITKTMESPAARASRQKRFREYVREKRRR